MRDLKERIEMKQRGDSMPRRDQPSLLAALSGVFAVLSEVFLEPEADVKIRLGEILNQCPAHCPGLDGLPAALAGMMRNCDPPQHQAVEYVRLFLHGSGNPTVHPYESVYTHGRLMAPECLEDLRALHEAAGIRPRTGVSLPPDHLGLELEFLAYVLERVSGSDGAEAQGWQVIAETLLRRHLIPFGRHFVRRMEEAKPHLYYAFAGEALVHGLHACTLVLGLDTEYAEAP
jgi:TorA maturation chaperone TorD